MEKNNNVYNLYYLFDRLCAADACYTVVAEELMDLEKIYTQIKVSLSTKFDSLEDENNKIAVANKYRKLIDEKTAKKLKLNEVCMQLGNLFATTIDRCPASLLRNVKDQINEERNVINHKAVRIEKNPKFNDYFQYLKVLAKRYSQYSEAIDTRIYEKENPTPSEPVPGNHSK